MTRRTNNLYLIRVKYQTVAIIPAKGTFDAIIKYQERIGFNSNRMYFCYLMANAAEINTRTSADGKYCVVTPSTKTISGDTLSISSQQVKSYNDIFGRMTPEDINDPLFIRPTVEEVRNCVGFSYAPERELRKFCI